MHLNSLFFVLMECWNFFGNLDFHKGTLIHWYLSEFMISTPRPWLRGDEDSSQAFASSTACTEVCLPITQCTVGWEFSQVPGIWCWIAWSLQRHFCFGMNAKFLLCLGGDTKPRNLCYPWCWCQSVKIIFSWHKIILSKIILSKIVSNSNETAIVYHWNRRGDFKSWLDTSLVM